MSFVLKVKGFASRKDVFFVLVICLALLIIIGLQQLLPSGKPIPIARIDGSMSYISSEQDIIDSYKITEERTLTLKINDYNATYKVRDLGIKLQDEETIRPYIAESRLRRLIPFSVLAHMYRDNKPSYTSSKTSLYVVMSAIADEVNISPKNAEILPQAGAPRIIASESGVKFEPEKSLITIYDAIANDQKEVVLASKVIEPEITTSELESAIGIFSSKLPDNLRVNIGQDQKIIDKDLLSSWLDYKVVDGSPVIGFNEILLENYAQELSDLLAKEQQPTATLVTLVDGQETGRIEGRSGKIIIASELMQSISDAINAGEQDVYAKLVNVPSPIKYTRNYTRSSLGLKEMLDQITSGREISIRFIDLNERNWDVGSRENTRTYMASTYKLFVAYSILKRVDEGSLSMDTEVNGKTVDACLQTMIIDSNNECAIAFAERIGWITIQNEGKALGATGLDWSQELAGTASDGTIIPLKLARGEILSVNSRDYLINLMKLQRFRSGIPSGTTNLVADKVGFFEGWLNDTGIVYAGDLPYVLSIYSYGESWQTIAQITQQIEALVR